LIFFTPDVVQPEDIPSCLPFRVLVTPFPHCWMHSIPFETFTSLVVVMFGMQGSISSSIAPYTLPVEWMILAHTRIFLWSSAALAH
jgi:hypothetical protein